MGRSSSTGRVKNFHLGHVQTGSGAHSVCYQLGNGGSFPGVKRPGREADHSLPIRAEIKKTWMYTSTSPYALMA
jgi:hypothetical protein